MVLGMGDGSMTTLTIADPEKEGIGEFLCSLPSRNPAGSADQPIALDCRLLSRLGLRRGGPRDRVRLPAGEAGGATVPGLQELFCRTGWSTPPRTTTPSTRTT